MSDSVRYGIASQLHLPADCVAAGSQSVGDSASCDVRRATEAALAAPLEFPPLAQAVVPGDRVTIAVDRFVPQAEIVAAVVVEQLLECGVEADHLAVVFPEARTVASLPIRIPAAVASRGKTSPPLYLESHNPDDRGRLSFLTNTRSGKPVYLNRQIADADLVILIGVAGGEASWSRRGPFGGVYPTFSDRAAQTRFRNPQLLDPHGETFHKSQQEVETIGWQLGAQFLVEVEPGRGDEAAGVVAGEIGAVRRRADAEDRRRHEVAIDAPVATVVAALTGREAQTWERAAAVLAVVAELVDDGGAIVLCTDLEEPLGPALELLSRCDDDDRDAARMQICRDRPADLFAALTLTEVQRRARVFLLSRFDSSVVESLGMTPIADPADVARLVKRRGSCAVVTDAQWAVLSRADSDGRA